ncbi:hypothetical protein V1L54_27085 [Streptomyces sp. TRM 70361]|uniref:hypothetical protein n=1 Tax=Streptomyces sp. TRM 70361 TaxID=3116553 RepID=UPI002E7B6C1D|nr:hypothetical protein [Streptomyces sp. TRM 70361]MEE1943025.1 hypothetical protein [Streptomyces sp. TRM 70361]
MTRNDGTTDDEINSVIEAQVSGAYDDASLISEIGLDSLAVVRMAVQTAPGQDTEIDLAGLAGVRTIGDLRQWLGVLRAATAGAQ